MNSNVLKKQLAKKIVDKARVRLPRDLRHQNLSIPAQPCSVDSSFYVQSLFQNHSNFKRSAVPARLMYRVDDSWVDFSKDVIDSIQSGFVDRNPMFEVEIGGFMYLFDFYRMLVVDLDTGDERSVAWIDVNNQCFFPNVVVGGECGKLLKYSNEIRSNIEIEIRVRGVGDSNKRKRECEVSEEAKEVKEVKEEKSVGSCSNVKQQEFKKKRQLVCSELESSRWIKAKLMEQGEKAYSVVKNLFMSWVGIAKTGATVTSIHQFTRTTLMDRASYDVFQNQLDSTKAARGDANVAYAWLRCSADGVEKILNHGFSNPCKPSAEEAYGIGIYLSPVNSTRVSEMVPDTGENHVILCRVILGKCEKVEAGSQQLYPSSVDFDTGVDDVSNPKWYIVWGAYMNTHIFPECVVSYKHTHIVRDQLSGTSNLKWVPNACNSLSAKFFLKLIDALPSSKIPELQTLCGTYKEGKVPKGIFMKKLRSFVGDQMLRSAMQEVCG